MGPWLLAAAANHRLVLCVRRFCCAHVRLTENSGGHQCAWRVGVGGGGVLCIVMALGEVRYDPALLMVARTLLRRQAEKRIEESSKRKSEKNQHIFLPFPVLPSLAWLPPLLELVSMLWKWKRCVWGNLLSARACDCRHFSSHSFERVSWLFHVSVPCFLAVQFSW